MNEETKKQLIEHINRYKRNGTDILVILDLQELIKDSEKRANCD